MSVWSFAGGVKHYRLFASVGVWLVCENENVNRELGGKRKAGKCDLLRPSS